MNSNEKKLREKMKEPFQKLIIESTSHGLPRIFKSKHWCTKIMWLFSFLASASYCAYIIKITISDYLEYDFITSIEEYTEIPSLFPSITFCNLNQFQTMKSNRFIRKYSNYSPDAAVLLLYTEILELNNSAKQSLSYGLNETLIKCYFNGVKCNESHFEWIYYPFLGNCFSFNSGYDTFGNKIALKNVSKSRTGLYLELFTGNPDLTPSFIKSNGFHILINNHTIKPMIDEMINVAPGLDTTINVNRIFTKKLPYPHNYCLSNLNTLDAFDSDVYRSIIKMKRTYRQKDCIDLCFQAFVINKCECYLTNLDRLNGTISCLNITNMECVNDAWRMFLASDVNKICSPLCPQECDSMNFKLSVSSLQFPNKLYGKTLMSNKIISSKFSNGALHHNDLKQSVLSLKIFYNDLTYTLISQQPKMQLFDLISNIGGLLGLFLGVSFLTLAEVLEAFLAIFQILIANLKSKKKDDNKMTMNNEEIKEFIQNF
jgi:hypothetical protein